MRWLHAEEGPALVQSEHAEHREQTVHLVGDIDVASSEEHGDLLCTMLDQLDAPVLLVNCADLDLLDPHGLAMMHRVHRHGAVRGVEVWWCELSPQHRQVIELSGLDRTLHLEDPPPS
jgi:anti-anti-sigma factor